MENLKSTSKYLAKETKNPQFWYLKTSLALKTLINISRNHEKYANIHIPPAQADSRLQLGSPTVGRRGGTSYFYLLLSTCQHSLDYLSLVYGSINVSKENFPWHVRCQPRIIDGSMISPSSEDTADSTSSWPAPAHGSTHSQMCFCGSGLSLMSPSLSVGQIPKKNEAIARYDNTSTLLSR